MKTYNIDKEMIKIIQNEIINEELMTKFIYYLLKEEKYSQFLKGIIIGNYETKYCHNEKKLYINYSKILEDAYYLFERDFVKAKKDLFINTWLLFVIFHEMEHIKQSSYFYAKGNLLQEFLKKEIVLSSTKISEKQYDKYHECFMFERIATFSSFGTIINMYSENNMDDDIYDCFLQYMIYYLESGYEFIEDNFCSPIEISFKLLGIQSSRYDKMIENCKLSVLNRAEYGLPLTVKQYNKIKSKVIKKYL